MALLSFFDRESTVAKPGYSRWMVPPAALCVHLCIGQAYAYSVFNLPMTKLLGITQSGPGDWKLTELKKRARRAGIHRFVYTSSCSVYGAGTGDFLDETAMPNPQTAYAECKVLVERDVGAMAGAGFSPVFLRNATAYGPSPRMRFDIVIGRLPQQRQAVEHALLLTHHAALSLSDGRAHPREVWFAHEPLAPPASDDAAVGASPPLVCALTFVRYCTMAGTSLSAIAAL